MSLVSEYRTTQEAIEQLQGRLAELEGSEELKKELAFEAELRDLLARHGKSLKQVIAILDPQSVKTPAAKAGAATKGQRGARRVKRYTNPKTGEVVDTKGGNHKLIKNWKNEYGNDEVESWATYP